MKTIGRFCFIFSFVLGLTSPVYALYSDEVNLQIGLLAQQVPVPQRAEVESWIQSATEIENRFRPEELTSMVRSLVRLRAKGTHFRISSQFVRIWEADAIEQINQFGPEELTESLNDLFLLGITPSDLFFDVWQKRTLSLIPKFGSFHLARSIYGLGMYHQVPSQKLILAWQRRALDILEEFTGQGHALSLFAFSKLKMLPSREYVLAWQDHAMTLMETFEVSELSSSLLAMARLGIVPAQDLLLAWRKQAYLKIDQMGEIGLANGLYSILLFGFPEVLEPIFFEMLKHAVQLDLRTIPTQGAHQIYLAIQYARLFKGKQMLFETHDLVRRFQEGSENEISRGEKFVGNFLKTKFKNVKISYWNEVTAAYLDYALPDQKIAFQYDGPYHFFRTSDGQVYQRPKDVFQDHLLKKAGWIVIRIPYHFVQRSWSSLEVDEARLWSYIENELLKNQVKISDSFVFTAEKKASIPIQPIISESSAQNKSINVWEARKAKMAEEQAKQLQELAKKSKLNPKANAFIPRVMVNPTP